MKSFPFLELHSTNLFLSYNIGIDVFILFSFPLYWNFPEVELDYFSSLDPLQYQNVKWISTFKIEDIRQRIFFKFCVYRLALQNIKWKIDY